MARTGLQRQKDRHDDQQHAELDGAVSQKREWQARAVDHPQDRDAHRDAPDQQERPDQ